MKYRDLEEKVLNYADDNNFLSKENLVPQYNRLKNSVDNLQKPTVTKSLGFKEYIDSVNNKISKVEDTIPHNLGKIFYDLVILAEINAVSLEDCLTEYIKNKK